MLTVSLRKTLSLEPPSAFKALADPILQLKAMFVLLIICASGYGSFVVGEYIEQLLSNKEAAAIALYMDSYVEPKVQELSAQSILSVEAKSALEKILSPASVGKPIVAFNIWSSDQIVFSSRGGLINRSVAPTPARVSALEGHVIAKYGMGSDDDDERALNVPLLRVYAPVRQTGTHNIIAVADTTYLAVNLAREIGGAQRTAYMVVFGSSIVFALLLFRMISISSARVITLGRDYAGAAQDVRKICAASSNALERADRKLLEIRSQLHDRALQPLSVMLLKLDALAESADAFRSEAAFFRENLLHCTKEIKKVSAGLSPIQLQSMTLPETVALGSLFFSKTEVRSEVSGLPQHVSLAAKTGVYQLFFITSELLSKRTVTSSLEIRAQQKSEWCSIELLFNLTQPQLWLLAEVEHRCSDLRHRIEALGGGLDVSCKEGKRLLVAATFGSGPAN